MTTTARDAAALDRRIDRIIRGEPDDGDGSAEAREVDALVATASLLHAVLPRFHPRFGFEATLADRLLQRGQGFSGDAPIPFPGAAIAERTDEARRVWDRYRRGLVAGGAIASGVSIAIPLAGAALVRWRRSRSSGPAGGIF